MNILDIVFASKLGKKGYLKLNNNTDRLLARNLYNKSSGQVEITTDTEPYIYRTVPVQSAYKEKIKKIVGASVVWNQIIQNGNFADGTNKWNVTSGVSMSASNNVLSVDGNTSTYFQVSILTSYRPTSISGHKYLIALNVKCSTNKVYVLPSGAASDGRFSPTNILTDTRCSYIWDCSVDKQIYCTLRFLSTVEGTAEDIHAEVHDYIVIDLTAMLGSAIANYVSTLEQSTAGSGIAWLQGRGLLTKIYYAYQQNKLESGCVSAHNTYDGETLLTNTELSPITLRGKLGLDNGELTVDGDIYNSDGSVVRNYEERAYQSGDESLANAITDGINTIVKLATPITEQTTPFTETARVNGGTEEFVDYEVTQGNRDIAIPVGHETDYYTKITN